MSGETMLGGPDPKQLKLLELLEFSFNHLSNPDLVSDRAVMLLEALVEDALIDVLKPGVSHHDERSRGHRYENIAKSVEAYIDASFSEAITVSQIAAELNLSTRVLQRAFKDRRGMTIRSYLSIVRLNAMRGTLLGAAPQVSVTSAALDSGLFHLGRASAAYRQRFGETPSETLCHNIGQQTDSAAVARRGGA
ncbi:AraC family transcriptional regulator [Meridianimarinicoccus marinus]